MHRVLQMCDLKPSVYTELLQLSDPNFGRWTLTFRMRDPKTSEIHMISASGSMHKFFSPCFLLGDATKISVNFFQKSKEKKKKKKKVANDGSSPSRGVGCFY